MLLISNYLFFSFYRKDCQIFPLDACNRNSCCLYNTIIKDQDSCKPMDEKQLILDYNNQCKIKLN